jgi:hypothetical protein
MDSKKSPYWYKLINILIEKDKITTGLTIPYIFRAYEKLGKPLTDIPHLINTILDSNTKQMPMLHLCPEIKHIVLLVEPRDKCKRDYNDYESLKNMQGQKALLLSTDASLGKTFDSVVKGLTSKYGNRIHSKDCSWSKGKKDWTEIDKEEITIIESIK